MPNTVTDQMSLVSTSTVTGGKFIFPPSVRPDEGFSLHVFSPAGEYLGVVNEHDDRLRARNGDTVLRINLGPRAYIFSGKLPTADGYERPYTATVILRVQRARQFATLYRQGSDPIELARLAMHGHLTRWTTRLGHDNITQENVRYHIERGVGFAESETGVGIVRVEEAVAYASEHHARIRGIVEQDAVDQIQHGMDARKHDETLIEDKKEGQAAREKADADALTNDRIAGRSAIFATLVDAQRKQLNDWFAQGYSLAELQQQNPQLFASLDQLLTSGSKPALPAADGSAMGASGSFSFSGASSAKPDSQPLDVESQRYDEAIGAKHRPAKLGIDGWRAIDESKLDVLLAYELVEVDVGGPAANAGLCAGDRIIQVGGKALADQRTLEMCWLAVAEGTSARITYIRDTTIITAEVAIIQ